MSELRFVSGAVPSKGSRWTEQRSLNESGLPVCACGGLIPDHHSKCHTCRTRRDRVCCDCGKEFSGSRKNCNECYELTLVRERECVDCSIAFVGKKRRCTSCQSIYMNACYERVKTEKEANRRVVRYGVQLGWYEARVQELNGLCAVCRQESERVLSIDHDHACCPGGGSCGECVRDLLCIKCNSILGLAGDSVELLMSLVGYLIQHSPNTEVDQPDEAREGLAQVGGDSRADESGSQVLTDVSSLSESGESDT